MTFKANLTRKVRRVESTRRALRQALNEMGFGRVGTTGKNVKVYPG
jgi:hypothetical protein